MDADETTVILKFPYSARAFARKPRTPEQRAARAAPVLAGGDPIIGLIQAYLTAQAAHDAALAKQETFADWNCEEQCHAETDAFNELIETVPQTIAGLRAWADYLDDLGRSDERDWMLEDAGPKLVATFAKALRNLAYERARSETEDN